MSAIIEWLIPTTDLNALLYYTINVYRSTSTEDGEYSLIDSVSSGPSNTTYTYTDANGEMSFFYYVRYMPSGGAEGSRVLARVQPSVREQRLRDKIYNIIPEVVRVRIDGNKTQIRDAIKNALAMVNAYAPVTSYGISNMPSQHEAAVEMCAQMLLYLEHHLQISIRDFSYGVSGIALNIDRGAKMNQVIRNLMDYWNAYIKTVKFADYPDAIGLGSSAMAVPQGRIFSMLNQLSN